MRILGIKLTHNAAVACIEDGRLLFSTELEKIDNRPRYTPVEALSDVETILDREGIRIDDRPTYLVIDGWKQGIVRRGGTFLVAPYHEGDTVGEFANAWGSLTRMSSGQRIYLQGMDRHYASTTHVGGHVVGAYAMSPYAAQHQPANVLVMDGGVNPRLYRVDPGSLDPVRFLGHVHHLYGIVYGIMGYYFGPYKVDVPLDGPAFGNREWPGKLMAYLADGVIQGDLLEFIDDWYGGWSRHIDSMDPTRVMGYNQTGMPEHALMNSLVEIARTLNISDKDVLRTLHEFLETLLAEKTFELALPELPLVFVGGSALNIKWNSALRMYFPNMFVPPCADDSGSAIGAAALFRAMMGGSWHLDWNVYAGPRLLASRAREDWQRMDCSVFNLANELHVRPDEPIVVLYGRAEIGPRALGHRSILMNPRGRHAQRRLNEIKGREGFRPVAPMCLEEYAPDYFEPGTYDPYMLFDHKTIGPTGDLREVTHTDGSARLQTVGIHSSAFLFELLSEFYERSGCPVLINTSANRNGAGFFPDVRSAMEWGHVKKIWADGVLYYVP